nr:MiaB/RimO family radical SAM methylthiotransferase [Bacteroidales bacterium]
MKKIAFHTLGCKLNFTESSALAQRFEQAGYTVVPAEEQADVYIVNTCTVTAEAEKKCRQFIHRIHRRFPQAEIAVTGCFSELRGAEIRAMAGVTYVLGTADKTRLIDMKRHGATRPDAPGTTAAATDNPANVTAAREQAAPAFTPLHSAKGRTRSFFKIQDGCDNFCTYCAIPYARGRSRSATIAQTVEAARRIAADGFKEVVFTGVNIGDFGRKNGERFVDLLRALATVDGIARWRLSSVEPDLLDSEIIELVADEPKFMPHFHIPLQAGSDAVLRAMKRRYDTAFFARKAEEIRRRLPDAFIAADVIVGFPTETAADFEDGYRFIESLPI